MVSMYIVVSTFMRIHPVITGIMFVALLLTCPELFEAIPPGEPGPFEALHDAGAAVRALENSGAIKLETQTVIRAIGKKWAKSAGDFLNSLRNGVQNTCRWTRKGGKAMYAGKGMAEAEAEAAHYGTKNGVTVAQALKDTSFAEVKVTGRTLDLREPEVYKKLGLTWEDMTDKTTGGVSDKLRDVAAKLAAQGIEVLKVPSARVDGGCNVIVLSEHIVHERDVTIVK